MGLDESNFAVLLYNKVVINQFLMERCALYLDMRIPQRADAMLADEPRLQKSLHAEHKRRRGRHSRAPSRRNIKRLKRDRRPGRQPISWKNLWVPITRTLGLPGSWPATAILSKLLKIKALF